MVTLLGKGIARLGDLCLNLAHVLWTVGEELGDKD